MKKLFIASVLLFSSVSSFAADNFIKVTTKNSNIEVIVVGHNGDNLTVGRDGNLYSININDLNISDENMIAIELADSSKELYEIGKRVVKASVNKPAGEIIKNELILSTLNISK